MRVSSTVALLGAAATAAAQGYQGFNYGSTFGSSEGQAKQQSDFEAEFKRAQSLPGQDGFNAARLYTMIQAGTAQDPISAIPAAIATKTKLLLGMWASAGQDSFNNELAALKTAIDKYQSSFTDLVVGLSIGSEDLYRITPTGITNKAGIGAGPDVLVNYINQVKKEIQGTVASKFPLGHVDTWTAWVNGTNKPVIDSLDWLGFDGYPYFESDVGDNSIDQAQRLFYESYNATVGVSGGRAVWVTETGWPVSGKTTGKAVPSTENAKRYWDEVACRELGKTNVFWYALQDSVPSTPDPSFGIIGSDLNSQPLFDLSCKNVQTSSPSPSSSSAPSSSSTASSSGSSTTGGSSGSTSTGSSSSSNSTGGAGVGAGTGASGNAPAPSTGGSTGGSAPSPSSSGSGSTTSTAPAPARTNAGNVLSSKQSTVAAVFALICLIACA